MLLKNMNNLFPGNFSQFKYLIALALLMIFTSGFNLEESKAHIVFC